MRGPLLELVLAGTTKTYKLLPTIKDETSLEWVSELPVEVYDKNKFIELSARAEVCRVVKKEEEKIAKVKARTKKYLYTIKIPLNELEEFIKQLKCKEIVEIGKKAS